MTRRPTIGMPAAIYITTCLVIWLCLLGALILSAKPAHAHDALPTASQPLGWAYGWDCCSLTDCRAVPHSAIEETPQGYRIKATGELIPYDSKKLRDSKDEDFHHCTKGGSPTGDTICLYRAPRGF